MFHEFTVIEHNYMHMQVCIKMHNWKIQFITNNFKPQ